MVLVFFLAMTAVSSLSAEDPDKYPSRPVILTIGWPPGGAADIICRAVAHVGSKYFSQPIVPVAKPGGAGKVALQNLLLAKPDGYTYHLGRTSDLSVSPIVQKFPFKMDEDFIPVAQLGRDHIVFSVGAKTPWKTIEELVQAAKKEPGKIQFAVVTWATTHLAMEKFCYEKGIKLIHVPFKGGTLAAIAVIGGHVPVITNTIIEALPHIQSGELRPLLTCGEERTKELPNVPTAKEKGVDVSMYASAGVIARKGTPPTIISEFESMLKRVTEDDVFISNMSKIGLEVKFMPGKTYSKYWSEERKWIIETAQEIGAIKMP